MTYKEQMRRMDAERRLAMSDEFDLKNQPKPPMPIKTTCERIQPYAVEMENGELTWEARTMPRWQMEMFKVFMDWAGARYARWSEVFHFQHSAREFRKSDSLLPDEDRELTKAQVEDRRRMYPRKVRARIHVGD